MSILFLLGRRHPAIVAAEYLAHILIVRVHAVLVADVLRLQDDARLPDNLVVTCRVLLVFVGLLFVVAAAGTRKDLRFFAFAD